MMEDRGYIVEKIVDNKDTKDVFMIASKAQNRLLIYYVESNKINVKNIKEIEIILNDTNCNELLLIYKCNITTFAKQYILCDMKHVAVQCFSRQELAFNVTKHVLVPKHEILNTEEKKNVLANYKTPLKNFPYILESDPVAKYYNMKHGQLVKITRYSASAGNYVLYRTVM